MEHHCLFANNGVLYFYMEVFMKIKITKLIQEKKMTIYNLHKLTLIDLKTILRIANNEVKGCQFTTLDKIARALDVSIDELFDREDYSDEESS